MSIKKKEDFLLGLILLIFSAFTWVNISSWQKTMSHAGGVGISPSFFPSFSVSVLGILGFFLVARNFSLVERRFMSDWSGSFPSLRKYKIVAYLILLNFGYVFLIVVFGYFLATFAYMLILGYFTGNKKWAMVGISTVQLVIIHLFFEKLLIIQLPKGLLHLLPF